MGEVGTIGLDLAKNVFQAHGADASGGVVFRKQMRRGQVLEFFGRQGGAPPARPDRTPQRCEPPRDHPEAHPAIAPRNGR